MTPDRMLMSEKLTCREQNGGGHGSLRRRWKASSYCKAVVEISAHCEVAGVGQDSFELLTVAQLLKSDLRRVHAGDLLCSADP